jgi:hypothetical protein
VLVPVDESLFFIPGTRFGVLSVSGIAGLGPNTEGPAWFDYRNFQLLNTITWTPNRHTLKAGVDFTRWSNDQDAKFLYGGWYQFNSVEDFIQNRAGTFTGEIPGSTTLGGQGKTGHSSTLQNRPFPVSGIEASEFYRTLSPDCKSVWTFVRQLRGPHFSTCA